MAYIIKDKINFLAEASKILSSSLDYNLTLSSVANLLVSNVSDFCTVDIFVGKKLRRFAVKIADPEFKKYEKQFYDFLPDPKNKKAVYETAHNGKARIIKKVTKSWMEKASQIPEEIDLVGKIGLTSLIFAPMVSRNKVIGVVTIASSKKGFEYQKGDAVFMEELATRIGIAIDKARLYSEAKEALRTRDEFLSIATHELKTPLTAILLNLQIILYKIKKTNTNMPEVDSIIKMIEVSEAQSQRMSRLINDLLNVSVVSTGRLKIEKEKVELNELIRQTIERFEAQSRSRGINIKFDQSDKIFGNWDRIRLEQVISNLLSNAIKYGNQKSVDVTIEKIKNKALIKVKDQGIGISKKNQEIIFDRFKRAVGGKKYRGLGVGLYISQQIVKAHKGNIKVISETGKGSEFIIELPID